MDRSSLHRLLTSIAMQVFMIFPVRLLSLAVLALPAVSCNIVPQNESPTTAEGVITNRYTGLPVALAPVTVGHISSGFGYKNYDSVTTVYSDVNGHYRVAFDSPVSSGTLTLERYVVHVLYSQTLYDLTNQPSSYPWEGTMATRGRANKIDLEVTPYKKVTVRIPAGKAGQRGIDLSFNSTDRDNWFGNIILTDTNRTHQLIGLTRIISVLPNRDYRFYKSLFGNGNALTTTKDRRVLYNDTTTITF